MASNKAEDSPGRSTALNIETPSLKEKAVQKPVAPISAPVAVKPCEPRKSDATEIGITLSHKEWKEVEAILKKSIDENT